MDKWSTTVTLRFMIQLTVAEGTVLFKLHEEKYTNPQTRMINSVLWPPPKKNPSEVQKSCLSYDITIRPKITHECMNKWRIIYNAHENLPHKNMHVHLCMNPAENCNWILMSCEQHRETPGAEERKKREIKKGERITDNILRITQSTSGLESKHCPTIEGKQFPASVHTCNDLVTYNFLQTEPWIFPW